MCRTLSTLTSQGRYRPHPISEQLHSPRFHSQEQAELRSWCGLSDPLFSKLFLTHRPCRAFSPHWALPGSKRTAQGEPRSCVHAVQGARLSRVGGHFTPLWVGGESLEDFKQRSDLCWLVLKGPPSFCWEWSIGYKVKSRLVVPGMFCRWTVGWEERRVWRWCQGSAWVMTAGSCYLLEQGESKGAGLQVGETEGKDSSQCWVCHLQGPFQTPRRWVTKAAGGALAGDTDPCVTPTQCQNSWVDAVTYKNCPHQEQCHSSGSMSEFCGGVFSCHHDWRRYWRLPGGRMETPDVLLRTWQPGTRNCLHPHSSQIPQTLAELEHLCYPSGEHPFVLCIKTMCFL